MVIAGGLHLHSRYVISEIVNVKWNANKSNVLCWPVSQSFEQPCVKDAVIVLTAWCSHNKVSSNKRLIKPLLVVRVGPGTNPKYGSHWTESLIATWRKKRKRNGTQKLTRGTTSKNYRSLFLRSGFLIKVLILALSDGTKEKPLK